MSTTEKQIELGEGWEATIYSRWDFPPEVIEAWDSISSRYGDAGIFLSYGWFENWWHAFGREGELFVAALAIDGAIAGIFPCRTLVSPDGIHEITFLTNDHTYYNSFLVDPACARAALNQFMRLLNKTNRNAQLFIDSINTDSSSYNAFALELQQTRTPFQTYTHSWAPWADVSGSTETYQKQLPRKRKSDLQRCKKKAEQHGKLSFEIIRQSDDLDSILDTIFQIEYKSWKGNDGTAIKCDAAVEAFYRGIARWAMRNDHLHIFILNLGDAAISMNLCLNSGRTMFCMKVGYDESFKNLSPGNLLYWEMFNYLFEAPEIAVYNFMGACEPWKMEWTNETHEYGWIRAYPRSLKGRSRYMLQYGWKNFIKRFDAARKIKMYLDGKTERHAV